MCFAFAPYSPICRDSSSRHAGLQVRFGLCLCYIEENSAAGVGLQVMRLWISLIIVAIGLALLFTRGGAGVAIVGVLLVALGAGIPYVTPAAGPRPERYHTQDTSIDGGSQGDTVNVDENTNDSDTVVDVADGVVEVIVDIFFDD